MRTRIIFLWSARVARRLRLPSLGHNIFRFCPNDTREAEALVALLQHDGIRAIFPLWRNDAGNNGLHDAVQIRFQAFGGRVASGFRYEPTTTDFSVATNSVASQIANLVGGGINPSAIAVYLAAFDEAVDVFHSAEANSTLANTAWYGSDGVALSAALTGDSSAAGFAASVGYPNPIFGLPDALRNRWQPIADEIEARSGITPKCVCVICLRRALCGAAGITTPEIAKEFRQIQSSIRRGSRTLSSHNWIYSARRCR